VKRERKTEKQTLDVALKTAEKQVKNFCPCWCVCHFSIIILIIQKINNQVDSQKKPKPPKKSLLLLPGRRINNQCKWERACRICITNPNCTQTQNPNLTSTVGSVLVKSITIRTTILHRINIVTENAYENWRPE
jgi:hypothetical protein